MKKSPSIETTFLFHRAEGFYPIHIPRNTLADNIRLNPGTLKVEEFIRGDWRVVWTPPDGWLDVELCALQGESR